jgi:hypothetical protein
LGYRVVCVTDALVWNKVERPSNVPIRLRNLGLENNFRAFLIGRNRILFMKRHSGPLSFIIFELLFLPVYLFYFSIACSRHRHSEILRAFLRGTVAGMRKNLSKVVRWDKTSLEPNCPRVDPSSGSETLAAASDNRTIPRD